MTQCPVPAVPQPPALIVFPETSFTDEQVAEFERLYAYAVNEDGYLYVDPGSDYAAVLPPADVPLAELPPRHLLRDMGRE